MLGCKEDWQFDDFVLIGTCSHYKAEAVENMG
jgi:hypothetical protein